MINKFSFIVFLTLTLSTATAQIEQVDSREFEMEFFEPRYKAIGLSENGIMLYRPVQLGAQNRVELVKLDTAMKTIWKVFFPVNEQLNLVRTLYKKDILYFLFRNVFITDGSFQVATVNVKTGGFNIFVIKNGIPFVPIEFTASAGAVLIGGYFNYRPIILYFNFSEGQSKILPGFFNEPGELDQIKSYDDGTIDIIVSAKNFERKRCLWIRNYDETGTLIKTTIIQPEKGKSLLFGHSVKLENGDQLVAGVYGRYSQAEYSRGIFVAGVSPSGEYQVQYYNFGNLENFFSYMKDKREKRLKDRVERKTIRGKKVKFNYRFLVDDIIPYKDQYIMTGEAFYPQYVYPNQWTTTRLPSFTTNSGNYYSPPMRTDAIFDGYRYTHAVVIGFDKNGKLKWDNSFEINDAKTMELEKFVKVRPEKERILMMYLSSGTIRSKIIHDAQVLEGKSNDPVKSKRPKDRSVKIYNTEGEQLEYWYGKYFFAYGIQTLQNKTGAMKRSMFLNKVSYK